MKKIIASFAVASIFLLSAGIASAHVIVRPNQVGIGATQVFTMAVPSEKDIPTVSIRLLIPDGLDFVVPNVKPGWTVQIKTQATGKQIKDDDGMMVPEMKPVEIDWTGGSIPAGQRDEFNFQAQAPATATTLDWKAYQTYADGSVVNWDQDPSMMPKTSSGQMDMSKGGPYSMTAVVNDLSPASTIQSANINAKQPSDTDSKTAIVISLTALVFAVFTLIKKGV